jgi:putative ABC transport system permease protein
MGFGSAVPLQSDIFISPENAENMKKLVFSDLLDLFRSSGMNQGYSLVTVRAISPKQVSAIKEKIEGLGYRTFALIDQFEEMKKGFLIMDLFLAALGMIAIFVALLGIVNTMLMSIFERYKEIGIMKAIGASDRDIQKIFLFESGAIGFIGGIFGFILGWIVSSIVNQVVNYFLAKQGIPFIDYFYFPWWLGVGAVVFAVIVSLAAGIYPTVRAARIDPVSALRHE